MINNRGTASLQTNTFAYQNAKNSRTGLLLLILMIPALIWAPNAWANSGTYSHPYGYASVTYNVSGATLGAPQDSAIERRGYFHYTRAFTGQLNTGALTVSGSVSTTASNRNSSLTVKVNAGGQQEQHSVSFESGTQESFSISVPIPAGATSGSFSISVTNETYMSSIGETRVDIVTVNGTLSGSSQNRPPTVTLGYTPANPTPTDTVSLNAVASDPDGDTLTYAWYSNGKLQNATSSNVVIRNPSVGIYTLRVVVSDGRGGMAEDSVTFTVREGALQIELNVFEGQQFLQADDLPLGILVSRSDTKPVSGATVNVKVYSPTGRLAGSTEMVTETDGQASWRAFFTACAAVGNWRIEVQATTATESASLTRTVALSRLSVSSARVQQNIQEIVQLWIHSPQVPNGVDQPYIAKLWWPKGPKVNFREWRDRTRYGPYTCSSQAIKTLTFLNSLRFSVQKERRLLMAGVDYGPISDGTGQIHVAVGLYPKGEDWLAGYVLEPWFNQRKEAWNATIWSVAFVADPAAGNAIRWVFGNPWSGEYPTTGSDGGYYPQTGEMPPSLRTPGKTRVLTYSPAFAVVSDSMGRRIGRLPDGTVVNEIPGAEQAHKNVEDGTYVNMISVPDGQYVVHVTGTDEGTFHLAIGTDQDMVNYGEQPIGAGQQATLHLVSDNLDQPLELPGGVLVDPLPGLHDEDEDTGGGGGGGDPPADGGGGGGGGGCFLDILKIGK
jgi:hypothetical protein